MNRRAAAVPLLSLRSAEREGLVERSGADSSTRGRRVPVPGWDTCGGELLAERSPPRGHRVAPERMTGYWLTRKASI